MTEFTQDIGTAAAYGFGFAGGVLAFGLVVLFLAGAIVWWMGRK